MKYISVVKIYLILPTPQVDFEFECTFSVLIWMYRIMYEWMSEIETKWSTLQIASYGTH